MEQTGKQNKMGAMPVSKLLLNLGIPMMLSMLVQALYNMVDTFFVTHIPDTAQVAEMGDKAINTLTLAAASLVWWAIAVAEAASCAAAVFLTRKLYRKRVAVLPE